MIHLVPRIFWNDRRLSRLGDRIQALPECQDARALAIIEICVATMATGVRQDQTLYVYLVQLALSKTLDERLTPATPFLIGTHASVIRAGFGKLREAWLLQQRAEALFRLRPSPRFAAKMVVGWYVVRPRIEDPEAHLPNLRTSAARRSRGRRPAVRRLHEVLRALHPFVRRQADLAYARQGTSRLGATCSKPHDAALERAVAAYLSTKEAYAYYSVLYGSVAEGGEQPLLFRLWDRSCLKYAD